jgi:predicted nucleic acid-binding protein
MAGRPLGLAGRGARRRPPVFGGLSAVDGLLAATALHHNLTLVTRNTRDVGVSGVPVLDPWKS